jgi:hypothetical protein
LEYTCPHLCGKIGRQSAIAKRDDAFAEESEGKITAIVSLSFIGDCRSRLMFLFYSPGFYHPFCFYGILLILYSEDDPALVLDYRGSPFFPLLKSEADCRENLQKPNRAILSEYPKQAPEKGRFVTGRLQQLPGRPPGKLLVP